MNPLLKWPGGKRWLVPTLRQYLPEQYGRYFEPFCGGAALFFALEPKNAVLSDINPELIECYETIAEKPEAVISMLSGLINTEEKYYEVREWCPKTPVERAVRLIYLCRLSFNGIYRVNHQGEYNVPYGRKFHVVPCDPIGIRKAARVLGKASLRTGDFATHLGEAKSGDLIYIDPPYTVAHARNGFIKYNQTLFSWDDQMRLASTAEMLRQRGCIVFVSAADHETIRRLYPSFRETIIERYSVIAGDSTARKRVTESFFIANTATNRHET